MAIRIALATILAVLLAVCVFSILRPDPPQAGLDASWAVVTGEASARRVQWGTDLTFTYGPAAPIVTRYFNADYFTHTLPLTALVSISFGLLASCLLVRPGHLGASILAAAAFVVLSLVLGQFQGEWVYYALGPMVFLLGLQRRGRLDWVSCLLGCLVLGVLPLTKSSFAIAALPLLGLLDLRQLVRRTIPWHLPVFTLGFLAAYLFYGQKLADLAAYALLQVEVARGYSEAMGLPGPHGEIIVFLLLGAAWFVATVVSPVKAGTPSFSSRFDRIALAAAVAFYVFILFKAGYTRHDSGHVPIALTSLAMGFLLHAATLAGRTPRIALALGGAGLGLGLVLTPATMMADADEPVTFGAFRHFYRERVGTPLAAEAVSFASNLGDLGHVRERLELANQAAWDEIRARSDLPRLDGTTDIVPSEQSGVIASGSTYRPRPSFQEYSTYTRRLVAANAAFLSGPQGPAYILFAPGSIDDRYPTTAEGGLWPDLLTRYEPVASRNGILTLHRREEPVGNILGAPEMHRIHLGEPLPLPQHGPIFAKIEVRRSLLGSLANLVFRSPILSLLVTERSGRQTRFRFVPEIGAAGFLLSPLVEDAAQFAALGLGMEEDLRDREIVSVAIDIEPAKSRFFDADIDVELRALDTSALAPSARSQEVYADLVARRPWLDLLRLPAFRDAVRGDRLVSEHAAIPLAGTEGHNVRIGFGLLRTAWIENSTGPVCFSAAMSPDGPEVWSRCLDPVRNPAERGDQTAEIDAAPGATEVVLSTSCSQDCSLEWAYWNGFGSKP